MSRIATHLFWPLKPASIDSRHSTQIEQIRGSSRSHTRSRAKNGTSVAMLRLHAPLGNEQIMIKERKKSAIINETAKRAHKREASTLVERMRKDPVRSARLDARTATFKLEDQISRAMESEGVSATQLAARIKAGKATISRDLRGGLTRANYQRIVSMATALNHDVVTLVLPRSPKQRKKTLDEAFSALVK